MEKLLILINILQRANGRRFFALLLSHMVIIMGLVMTTAIMLSAMLVGGLMNAHSAMLNHGIPPMDALFIIGVAALFIIAMLVSVIVWRLRKLRNIPRTLFEETPFASGATKMFTAFTDGLMAD